MFYIKHMSLSNKIQTIEQTQLYNYEVFFLHRELFLTRKLLSQGFSLVKLKSSLRKYYGRHHDLVDRYGIYVSLMITDMFHLS